MHQPFKGYFFDKATSISYNQQNHKLEIYSVTEAKYERNH